MKARMIVFVCFVFILGYASASAEPLPPDAGASPVPPPTPAPPLSCELEKDQLNKRYDECREDVRVCEKMQIGIAQYAIDQGCFPPGTVAEQVVQDAKNRKPPPPRRTGTTRGGGRRTGKSTKDAPKPPAETSKVKKIKIVTGEPETQAPGPLCKNGSLRMPIGLDKDGDGKFDADEADTYIYACKGDKGDPGKNGAHVLSKSERFSSDAKSPCSGGGTRTTTWTDYLVNGDLDKEEKPNVSYVCDGKSGSAGRPGANGNTRVQIGLGMRASAVWSKDRPTGYSAAPEGQLELWLSPTVEFVTGIAWAPEGDRNMVVTTQLRRRALDKRVGIALAVQYQAWNLVGNKALWQTVTAGVCGQLVLIEGKWIDVSADACALGGLDGYDEDAQAAVSVSGGLGLALKL